MRFLVKAPRGTRDIFFEEALKWEKVSDILVKQAKLFGFERIRTPVFEYEELFSRSSGEGSDVVQKEMYTFSDKAGRKLALRPEGTAGVVRSVLENGIVTKHGLPLKVFYLFPCYRYEKPQSERYREFTQFGVELLGSSSYFADAQLLLLAKSIFRELSIKDRTVLKINSIGCASCRGNYILALKSFLLDHGELLCYSCYDRLESNPMRILDCKNLNCKKILEAAPSTLEFLCQNCRDHFSKLRSTLDHMGVEYILDPMIVRGLDYYTGAVFEFDFKTSNGSSLTVGGGGRYDDLIEQLGGNSTASLGFALGLDRLIFALDDSEKFNRKENCKKGIFVASADVKSCEYCLKLVSGLLDFGILAEFDLMNRSLTAQLKYASKKGFKFLVVIGDKEIKSKEVEIKDLSTGNLFKLPLYSSFCESIKALL